jgi:hypothetical protein
MLQACLGRGGPVIFGKSRLGTLRVARYFFLPLVLRAA